MDCSKNERLTSPFKKFSRLRYISVYGANDQLGILSIYPYLKLYYILSFIFGQIFSLCKSGITWYTLVQSALIISFR